MRLYSWGNRVENELAWRGWDGHETEERRRWAQLSASASCVLDVGANTGTFAFTAKALNPKARVYAFEPLVRVAKRIEHNCRVSGLDVTVVQTAVAESTGEALIHDPGGANAYSASLDADFLDGRTTAYPVPLTSLDAFCDANSLQPDLIKIDVEGAEGKVILGASRVLSRGTTWILCEWLGSEASHIEAAELLHSLGYRAYKIDTLAPAQLGTRREQQHRNLLFCPPHLLPTVDVSEPASSA